MHATTMVDEATGEVIETQPAELVPADGVIIDEGSAELYATMHEQADAMRARQARVLAEVREELEIERLQKQVRELEAQAEGLAQDDPRWQEAQSELDEARGVADALADRWKRTLHDAEPETVKKAGRVRLRRGKRRETWSLSQPPSWYATREAKGDLLMLLIEHGVADAVGVAGVVLDWLAPKSKKGADPGVSVTLRPRA